jgi:hypothetical protein
MAMGNAGKAKMRRATGGEWRLDGVSSVRMLIGRRETPVCTARDTRDEETQGVFHSSSTTTPFKNNIDNNTHTGNTIPPMLRNPSTTSSTIAA